MPPYKTFRSENTRVEIWVDDDAVNPRDDAHTTGTFWAWHRRYNFGSKEEVKAARGIKEQFTSWDQLDEWIRKEFKAIVVLPVFMYEHSGIALNCTGFSCPWDSGRLGVVFCTREALKDAGYKIATAKALEKLTAILKQEIETYSAYASGAVYGYRVFEGDSDEETDSCWGYYGDDEIPYMLEAALGPTAKEAVEV